jgi:hypothetical protein
MSARLLPQRGGALDVRDRNARGAGAGRTAAWLAGVVLLELAALAALPAGPAAADDGGGTEGPFRFGPTARGISLGASMVVLGEDASATFWNPALLRRAPITQLSFSHNRLAAGPDGTTLQYAGVVVPTLGAGGFGVALLRVGVSGIPAYDAASRPTGSIDFAQTQLLLGYGSGVRIPWLGGRVDLGLTAKVHWLEVGESATSGGLDCGLRFHPPRVPRLSVAAAFQDVIAPSFRLVEREDTLPHTARYAASWQLRSGPGPSVRLAASYEHAQYADARIGLAAEAELPAGWSARLGVAGGRVGVGAGGRWRAYALDYAFQSGSELGASHYFTLTWRVGQTIAERRDRAERQRAVALQQATQQAVQAWLAAQADSSLQQAHRLLAASDLTGAERELQRAAGLRASAQDVAAVAQELAAARAQEAVSTQDLRERAARVAGAADQVRTALDGGDPLRARGAFDRLAELAADHPLLARYRDELAVKLEAAAAQQADAARQAQQQGDWLAALQAWSDVLRLAPQDSTAHQEIARLRDDLQGARTRAAQAGAQLTLAHRYTEALQAFADGRVEQALALAQQILAQVPEHREARELAERARRALAGPAPLSPEHEAQVRRLYLAGLSKFTAGLYGEAIAQWEQILQIDPGNPGALSNIREARTRMEHLGEKQSAAADAEGGGGRE